MRAMVVVFFLSRARVLRVRMSSFVQGWRLTFFAIRFLPSRTNLPTHIQYNTFIAYKTLSVDNPSASSKPLRQAIHRPYKHHLDAEVVLPNAKTSAPGIASMPRRVRNLTIADEPPLSAALTTYDKKR